MGMRIHEAGHVLARIAVAPTMGWPRDKIITRVEYVMPDKEEERRLWFSNSTHGLFLSTQMHEVAKAYSLPTELAWRPVSRDEAVEMFDRFRRVGCNLKDWMFARYKISLGGAVAEAMFLKKDVWTVIAEQFDDGDDFPALMRDLDFLRRKHPSETMLKLSANYLRWVFSQAEVWRAIVAVAKALKRGEATPGAEIIKVVNQHLKEMQPFDFNNLPQARIRRDPISNSVATCFLMDLDDWHFSDVSGGRQVRTDKQYLYAKLWCSEVIDDNVGHSCTHGGDGPHEIRVCLLPEDNHENWEAIGTEAAWALHHAA